MKYFYLGIFFFIAFLFLVPSVSAQEDVIIVNTPLPVIQSGTEPFVVTWDGDLTSKVSFDEDTNIAIGEFLKLVYVFMGVSMIYMGINIGQGMFKR